MVVNAEVKSGSYIIWISKIIQKYHWSATNKQNIIMTTYKELLRTCIKSKKVAYIYRMYQTKSNEC